MEENSNMYESRRKIENVSKLNSVLNVILKMSIVITVLLVIAISTLYFIFNDPKKFNELSVKETIDSIDFTRINNMYKLEKISTEYEKVNIEVNNRLMKFIDSKLLNQDTDYTKVSNALNYYEFSVEYNENEINKFAKNYVCKVIYKYKGEQNSVKLIYNYNLRKNDLIVLSNIIKDDKIEEFKGLLRKKYNMVSPDLENILLTKKYIEIFSDDFKSNVKVNYDDIEEYLVNQVLTSDNITNYYTIFKDVIDPTKPMIALTFDDGPYTYTTERILNVLTEYHGHATFFVLGSRVDTYASTVRKIVEQGSQIGNHTNNHLNLTQQSEATIASEINFTKARVMDIAGYDITVMRPPYGNRNDAVKRQANCPLILWNVDTLDWQSRNAYSVRQEILSSVSDGAIILMHDIYESTAQAVEITVPELVNLGYQLVTIDELYYYKGKEKIPGEVVYSIK